MLLKLIEHPSAKWVVCVACETSIFFFFALIFVKELQWGRKYLQESKSEIVMASNSILRFQNQQSIFL
jgi:hypothetical protein